MSDGDPKSEPKSSGSGSGYRTMPHDLRVFRAPDPTAVPLAEMAVRNEPSALKIWTDVPPNVASVRIAYCEPSSL